MSYNPAIQIKDAQGNVIQQIVATSISVNNSSLTTLGIAGVFTGVYIDLTQYIGVDIFILTNVSGTLNIDNSIDGVTIDKTTSFNVTGGTAFSTSVAKITQFSRIRYVNGGVAQATFRLQTSVAININPNTKLDTVASTLVAFNTDSNTRLDTVASKLDTVTTNSNTRLDTVASTLATFNASSDTKQNAMVANTNNLDVALSTRLKPADTLTKVSTVDTITNPVAAKDSILQTYMATTTPFLAATSPTDVFVIKGSATKTVKVRKIIIEATKTANALVDVFIIKRSADNTGGTFATLTIVPIDSTNNSGTAVVRNYTANPTSLGASVGNIYNAKYFIQGGTASVERFIIDFDALLNQPLILRGVAQILAINLNATGTTMSGGSWAITTVFTEE